MTLFPWCPDLINIFFVLFLQHQYLNHQGVSIFLDLSLSNKLGCLNFIKEPIKSKGATILAKGKENANPQI
jgi:hypothetical protein